MRFPAGFGTFLAVLVLACACLVVPVISAQTTATRSPAPAATANLTTVEGITLTRIAKTDEEEEELAGMRHSGDFSESTFFLGDTTIEGTGTPEDILDYVLQGWQYRNSSRVFMHEVSLPKGQYKVKIVAPSKSEAIERIAAAVGEAFKVRIVHEPREVPVLRVEADPEKIKNLPKGGAFGTRFEYGGSSHKTMTFEGPLSSFPSLVAGVLRDKEHALPIVDGTKIKGSYIIKAEWDEGVPGSFEKALGEIGIKLVPAKEKLDGYHVEKLAAASQPATAPGSAAMQK